MLYGIWAVCSRYLFAQQIYILLRAKASRSNHSNVLPLISELPIASQEFFGRRLEMSQLCDIFHSHQSSQKAVVIWGFGGLGKTRLALQYVRAHQSNYSFVLWINAATLETAVESFSQATSNIISRSKSISPPTSGEGDIDFVHRWLRSQAKDNWLLVIDSLDDPELDCRCLIPQWSGGNIMITSTLSQVAKHLDYRSFELGSINSAAGADMLLSKLPPSHNFEGRMCILFIPCIDANFGSQKRILRKESSKHWAACR